MKDLTQEKKYQELVDKVVNRLLEGREKVKSFVHSEHLLTYWDTGKYIVEYEQQGRIKAEYGKKILIQLSKDIKTKVNKGYSRSKLVYARLLYIKYPKSATLSHQLTWSHYIELLKIDDD